jgi:hypothetical protein
MLPWQRHPVPNQPSASGARPAQAASDDATRLERWFEGVLALRAQILVETGGNLIDVDSVLDELRGYTDGPDPA